MCLSLSFLVLSVFLHLHYLGFLGPDHYFGYLFLQVFLGEFLYFLDIVPVEALIYGQLYFLVLLDEVLHVVLEVDVFHLVLVFFLFKILHELSQLHFELLFLNQVKQPHFLQGLFDGLVCVEVANVVQEVLHGGEVVQEEAFGVADYEEGNHYGAVGGHLFVMDLGDFLLDVLVLVHDGVREPD